MHALLKAFFADASGATAIEYGLIAAGIAGAIIATVQALGTTVEGMYTNVETVMK